MTAAIAVEGLRHRYGEADVLHDVAFEVPWGSIVGYLGPNGAGKTTTLKAIGGLLRPTQGSVRVAGADPYDAGGLAARGALGFVPDDGGLYQLLSAREHLALVSDLHEIDPAVADQRQNELVDAFGMVPWLDRRIDTLSKGQRQRVALCCGFLHAPRVLVLDEPLTGLDVNAVRVFRERLRAHADQGGAVLYSSHILDVVERLCDRTVILSHGRVVADAPTAELLAGRKGGSLEAVFESLTRLDQVAGLGEAFADEAPPGSAAGRPPSQNRKESARGRSGPP